MQASKSFQKCLQHRLLYKYKILLKQPQVVLCRVRDMLQSRSQAYLSLATLNLSLSRQVVHLHETFGTSTPV